MKLRLEALSPTEGIGIIRSGQTLRLVRPPYTLRDAPVLAEDSIQDAILRHGFSACSEPFRSWEDAIAFLNEQAAVARRLLGKEIPNAIPGQDILDVTPPAVLSGFLDRIEREIIPRRLFDHAENFLLALLRSKAWIHQPEVAQRAAELLQRNTEARKKAEAGVTELAGRDVRFPSLERRQGELESSLKQTELIRDRGCVFAPVS